MFQNQQFHKCIIVGKMNVEAIVLYLKIYFLEMHRIQKKKYLFDHYFILLDLK